PDVLAVLRVNELSYNAKPVPILANATFNRVVDTEFFANLPDLDGLALVNEGGSTGDHSQVRESRKGRNNVFGDPFAQIAKILVGAKIIERKDGHGGNGGRNWFF